jgi:hypothetical protein
VRLSLDCPCWQGWEHIAGRDEPYIRAARGMQGWRGDDVAPVCSEVYSWTQPDG